MAEFTPRRISDPVHDTIGLSKVEVAIISSRSFQRLRHVRQLGLANFVFPGADYSRFSHCVGVCHVTGRILSALMANRQLPPDETKIQAYRLAGLLHDIGHYPFSHASEDAIKNHGLKPLLQGESKAISTMDHESVGKCILETDPEITAILKNAGIDPASISAIFNRSQPETLTNLISSDLDADRIDYLLRTAHFSGLPYGGIDLEYLLTQMRLDNENRLCLTSKAVCAADHFLLSRYFDYQQVSFHKTVAALEELLKQVMSAIIDSGLLDCSKDGVQKAIADGSWAQIDDVHVWGLIRQLAAHDKSTNAIKAQALLDRNIPKLIMDYERVDGLDRKEDFFVRRRAWEGVIATLAEKFGIDPSFWFLWHKDGITLTKVGSRVSVGTMQKDADPKEKDKYEQSIRILGNGGKSIDIMSEPRSLMSILSNNALYALRLYVLLPPDKKDLVPEIQKCMEAILNS